MVQEKPFDSTFEHHDLDLLVALDRGHDFPEFQNKLRAHEIERRVVEYHSPARRRLSIQPYLCLLRHCVHQILLFADGCRMFRNILSAAPSLLSDDGINSVALTGHNPRRMSRALL